MKVPLTINDFLDRAEPVYGERIGIVDEPDQPAPSLGELTYPEWRVGPRPGGRSRRTGRRRGERVAIVSHNAPGS